MNSLIFNNEPVICFSFLGVILILMSMWELLAPRRPLATSKPRRWVSNLAIVLIDTLALRLLLPATAVSVAIVTHKNGWGLLNNAALPYWLAVVVGVIVLDLTIYLQHVVFHALPTLWRMHMMHHSDLDFDITTGVRFHPLEVIISMGIKMAMVILLGASALAVVVFEVLLNGTSMFNHGNVRLPGGLDRVLRAFVVTPEMHRVHHSVVVKEHNSNFGFNFPWWDRLMGTYQARPTRGHEGKTIGLSQFRDPKRLTLPWLLLQAFIGKAGRYPTGV